MIDEIHEANLMMLHAIKSLLHIYEEKKYYGAVMYDLYKLNISCVCKTCHLHYMYMYVTLIAVKLIGVHIDTDL